MTQALRPLQGSDLFADSFGYLNGTDLALQTLFAGSSAPASPVAFQLWADTASNLLKMRTSANDAWITLGALGADFLGLLPLAGGVMGGSIDAGGFPLLNLGLGTGAAAARQQEVDLKASLAGPHFTGDAQVDQDPVANASLVRRSWTEGRYSKIGGGALTGPLILNQYAGAAYGAVPREQMETFVLFNHTTGHRHTGIDARRIQGEDIDSATVPHGQSLRADGAGRGYYAPTILCWGSVASGGSTQAAGTGNWSAARIGTGNYTLTINSGVLGSSPIAFATPNSSDTSLHAIVVPDSATQLSVRIRDGTNVAHDSAFSFIAI